MKLALILAISAVTLLLSANACEMPHSFSPAGGTLVLAVPTSEGLVVAADRRTTPRGIYCDGVRKILHPKVSSSVVFITGLATLRDMSQIPDEKLCETLTTTPSPIDFGRATVAFIEQQAEPIVEIDGQRLTEVIYAEVRRYLEGGELRDFIGQKYVATIVIGSFDPASGTARIWQFWVDFTGPVHFQLQPYPLRRFDPSDAPRIEPFGETGYFAVNVLDGIGRQFLDGGYEALLRKQRIADVSVDEACSVASSLIDAATKTTALVKPPSGIGGGVDCTLVSRETKVLRP